MKKALLLFLASVIFSTLVAQQGTLDTSFNPGLGASVRVHCTAIQTDGKILLGGEFTTFNGVNRGRIARVNSDGSLDTVFSSVGFNNQVKSIKIQPDGKIIVAGHFTQFNGVVRQHIVRLNEDGSIDNTFNIGNGTNFEINHVAIQEDGKIIIAGNFSLYNSVAANRLARLNIDGSIDESFNTTAGGVNNAINFISIQADEKILIGGGFTEYSGVSRNRIARLNTNGTLDTSFNPGQGANDHVRAIISHLDGKTIIAGTFTTYNGTGRNRIARLNIDGTLDSSFDTEIGSNSPILALTVQADSKILLGGMFTSYNGVARNAIARINSDGTLDPTFAPISGAFGNIASVSIQEDERIIIGGDFTSYDGVSRNHIARVIAGCSPTSATDYQSHCNTYTWIDGITYTESNSTATHTLTNSSQCDSIITLNLTITHNTSDITVDGNTLTSVNTGTYQWYNCKGNQPITGATSASFTPTTTGMYALQLTNGECVDMSECEMVTIVSVEEVDTQKTFLVYPNPGEDWLAIPLASLNFKPTQLDIFNSMGQLVYSQKIMQPELITTATSTLANGIYTLQLRNDTEARRAQWIKK